MAHLDAIIPPMLSDIERQLLRHYSRRERVIYWGMRRSLQHQRLLAFGYIREENRDIRALAVSLTPAGRTALADDPGVA